MHNDTDISRAIFALLRRRSADKSICPSEVARSLAGDSEWRALMPLVRATARTLAKRGQIAITQRGKAVDPDHFKGPIRIRLPIPDRSN